LVLGASGIPFIASKNPEYERAAFLGLGLTANSASEWQQKLSKILQDDDLRDDYRLDGWEAIRRWFDWRKTSQIWQAIVESGPDGVSKLRQRLQELDQSLPPTKG
jgi:glycosyltransferase involved in cell wall biosynthesis